MFKNEEMIKLNNKQQESIMRIRRMKRLFDKMENEILELTNTENCKCANKVDMYDLNDERLYKCDGSCPNYTLDEAIEKVEETISYMIEKEYR